MRCIVCTLATAAMILLSSCSPSPKFSVGDCYVRIPPDKESWTMKELPIYRIEEVGKFHYRTSYWNARYNEFYPDYLMGDAEMKYDSERKLVSCPVVVEKCPK